MNTIEAISNIDRILIDHIRARTTAGIPDAETNRDCNYTAKILLIQAEHLQNSSNGLFGQSLELLKFANKSLQEGK